MARILVIDDDPGIRAMLEQTLTAAGHEVILAGDGDEGINIMNPFQARPARVIITDIFMPGRNGLQVITELRARFPEAGIVAMSGRPAGTVHLSLAERLGADRTLTKPFLAEELLAIVDEVLNLRPQSPTTPPEC